MKLKLTLLFMLICALNMLQVKAQTGLSRFNTYTLSTTVGQSTGWQTTSNDTVWYSYQAGGLDQTFDIIYKNNYTRTLDKVLCYRDTNNLLDDSDIWPKNDSTINAYIYGISSGQTHYIALVFKNTSCGNCILSNAAYYRVNTVSSQLAYQGCTSTTACDNTPLCELVCNGSFEQVGGQTSNGNSYPDNPSQIAMACGWDNANAGTADLYHTLSTQYMGIPCNFFGSEPERTNKNAYAGFFAYDISGGNPNYKEAIYSRLKSPLVIGKTYNVSFYLSLADQCALQGVNNVGVAFSNSYTPIGNPFGVPGFTYGINSVSGGTQYFNTSTVSKMGWQSYTYTYTPLSVNEQYIIVGALLSGSPSATVGSSAPCPGQLVNPYVNSVYYYLDDVSVTEVIDFTVTPHFGAGCPPPINGLSVIAPNTAGSYSWSSIPTTASLTTQSGSSISINPSATTVYSVEALGCGNSKTYTVNPSIITPTFAINSSTNNICPGTSVVLSAASSGLNTFTWTSSPSTPSLSTQHGATVAVMPSVPTTYTVVGADLGCPNTYSATITINVNTGPTFSLSATNICLGASVSLLTGPNSTITAFAFGDPNNNFDTNPFTYVTPGNYNVYVEGTDNTCGISTYSFLPITVSSSSSPTLNVSPPQTICLGSSVTLSVSGASNYTWQPTGSNATSISVNPSTTTVYTVTGTSSVTCVAATKTIQVTVNQQPTVMVTPSFTTICGGSSVTLTASGATTYTWSTGSNATSISVTPSVTTIYTVTGGAPYCNNSSVTATVNVNTPNPTSITSSSNSICLGSSATLIASGLTTYTWLPCSGACNNSTLSVSPSASTVYSVTGVNSCGSVVTLTTSITVIGNPTITVSPTTSTICLGQSVLLTANGGISYTWTPTGVNSNTINASPISSAVYTVTGSNSCGLLGKATSTIIVNNPVQLTANAQPQILCGSGTSTLSAFGSTYNYTWQPTAQTGSMVVVSPSVTTTYTVYSFVPFCGNSSAVVTVSVIPTNSLSFSISSPTANPCLGSSLTLTANVVNPVGTYTYNWGSPINQQGQTVTYTPTDNNIYNCTVTDMCGNVKTSTVCISLVSNKCCTKAESLLNNLTLNGFNAFSNLSGGGTTPFEIQNTITIAGNVNWTSCDFRMLQGAKIVIKPGAKLTLKNCQLYSCTEMWEGIVLQSGLGSGLHPKIEVINSTIEDAYKAISLDLQNDVYFDNIITNSTQFNKNYIGIYISSSSTFSSTSSTGSVSINSTAAFTSSLTANSPGNKLKCSSFYLPYIKNRGYAGVYFNDFTSGLIIGTFTPPSETFYENLDYGYYGKNSRVRMYNSHFNKMTGGGLTLFPPPPPVGVGVYAINPSGSTASHVNVFDSKFTDVWKGVYLVDLRDFEVSTTTFSNSALPTGFCMGNCIGSSGVESTNHRGYATIRNNSFTNMSNAITQYYSVPTSPTFSLGIGQNTITSTPSGYIGQAIAIQSAANNYTTSAASIVVANNLIMGVRNGILANNIKSGLRISNNIVNIEFIASGTRAGIRSTGTENAMIDNNTVFTSSTANANISGIFMQLSPNSRLQCNLIRRAGRCIVYSGNNSSPTTGFINNKLTAGQAGLYLSNNGVISMQGLSINLFGVPINVPSGNTWSTNTSLWTPYKTFTQNSSAQNSKLVVRNTNSENPYLLGGVTTNSTVGGLIGIDNYYTGGMSPTLITTNVGGGLTCPAPLVQALRVAPPVQPINTVAQYLAQDESLLSLITNTAAIDNATKYIQKDFVYSLLKRPQTVTTNTTLINFVNNNIGTGLGKYLEIDSLIKEGQYLAAKILNNTAPVTTPIEQNKNDINTQLMNKLLNNGYSYSVSEVQLIEKIAYLCPLTDGNAVYQARTLLQIVKDEYIEFTDSCETNMDGNGKRMANPDGGEEFNSSSNTFVLFPNPNNGEFNLLYTTDEVTSGVKIKIMDIAGKIVHSQALEKEMTLTSIKTEHLSNGVYYISITDSKENILYTNKLIIIK